MNDSVARLNAALQDRYHIVREVGEGGMAVVYLAEDLRHERRVALKVLKPELAAVIGADRFLREIRVTAGLQHPHILPLFDSGEAEGVLFYVMPFIEGESLRERLTRKERLPVPDAVRILREIADALGEAHARGVVHRDIKPANVLLSGRLWEHPFVDGDRALDWEEAMERFTDPTGRPGPATWDIGSFPEGQEDFPVGGVSWYEAVAYARFVGKELPTSSRTLAVRDRLLEVEIDFRYWTEEVARTHRHPALGARSQALRTRQVSAGVHVRSIHPRSPGGRGLPRVQGGSCRSWRWGDSLRWRLGCSTL